MSAREIDPHPGDKPELGAHAGRDHWRPAECDTEADSRKSGARQAGDATSNRALPNTEADPRLDTEAFTEPDSGVRPIRAAIPSQECDATNDSALAAMEL